MERIELERILAAAEEEISNGGKPGRVGFWKAVAAVKRNPGLAAEYADRIAAIDRSAFERWALFTVRAAVGTAVMVAGTVAGLGVVLWAYYVEAPWNGLLLLTGTAATLVTTHGLGHLAVGTALGMRFTHWFIGTVQRPQPGVKVDYASYLRSPARHRAWMHAAGAVVTKLIPFMALGPAFVIPTPLWATTVLIVIGVGQIATDVLWSTKASDWMKYRREMRYVR